MTTDIYFWHTTNYIRLSVAFLLKPSFWRVGKEVFSQELTIKAFTREKSMRSPYRISATDTEPAGGEPCQLSPKTACLPFSGHPMFVGLSCHWGENDRRAFLYWEVRQGSADPDCFLGHRSLSWNLFSPEGFRSLQQSPEEVWYHLKICLPTWGDSTISLIPHSPAICRVEMGPLDSLLRAALIEQTNSIQQIFIQFLPFPGSCTTTWAP